MINLRAYRKTDWPCIRNIKVIPKTSAQNNFVKKVIISYITRYIEYGFLYNIPNKTTDLLFEDVDESNQILSLIKSWGKRINFV